MKKVLKNRITGFSIVLFYVCYALFLFSIMFSKVIALDGVVGVAHKVCLIMLTVACLLVVIRSRMSKKEVAWLCVITALALVSWIISNRDVLLFLWLLIVAARGIKFDNIIKFDLMIKIPALVIMPLLYFGGLTDVNVHYRDGIVRQSMGFSNPNVFGAYIMSVVAEILYLRREKTNWFDVLFAVIMAVIVDYYADSRTSILCIIAITMIFVINKFVKKKRTRIATKNTHKRAVAFLINHAFSISMIVSLIFSMLYTWYGQDGIMKDLDSLFTSRLRTSSNMIEKYEITPFGQKVKIVTVKEAAETHEKTQSLDNAYIYMLLNFGVIPTLAFCYFMKKYMQKAERDKDIIRYVMLVYIFCGFMEQFLLMPQFNIFLLCFTYLFYDQEMKKESLS